MRVRRNAMANEEINVSDQIVAFKRQMAPRRDDLKRAYASVTDHVRRAAEVVQTQVAAGRAVIPELEYRDIRDGTVADAARQAIRRAGCVVVRGVFPAALARDWFDDVGRYLETNHYEARE